LKAGHQNSVLIKGGYQGAVKACHTASMIHLSETVSGWAATQKARLCALGKMDVKEGRIIKSNSDLKE
jgi:hypothetical protein